MSNDDVIQKQENDLRKQEHVLNSVNLLMFIFLLLLVIMSIWFLRRRRISFLHESGLAIIYGKFESRIKKFQQWVNLILMISYDAKIQQQKKVQFSARSLNMFSMRVRSNPI